MRRVDPADADCGIAQALAVVGDWWTLLVVRDVAAGITKFDRLQEALGVSRKILAERLRWLVDHGVLERRLYREHPPRHDYLLTESGEGLLPVLINLQDWGTKYVLGDGSLSAAAITEEIRRLGDLVGSRLPTLSLTATDGSDVEFLPRPPAPAAEWTVIFCFPSAYPPGRGGYPPGWADIPGTRGCTVETQSYARSHDRFTAANAQVYGVSTQRPDELAAYAAHASLPYPLLSDQDTRLAAVLRLPTFRAGGTQRLKRATLLVDADRTIRSVQYPVADPAGSAQQMLRHIAELSSAPDRSGPAGPDLRLDLGHPMS
jgi:DNA-binding HxlR family transcriptional regulator/peroxiredoxin